MPRTEEQLQQIRDSKRQLILDTALELFAEHGFHTTSISKIAKKANISKGLIYNYFESKEELLIQIMMHFLNRMYKEFDPNKDGILTVEEFKYFIHYSLQNIKENVLQYKLYMALSTQPDVVSIIHENLIGNEKMQLIIKELYEYFERNGYKNPKQEMGILTSILKGATLQYVYVPDSIDLDLIEKRIIEMYCPDR